MSYTYLNGFDGLCELLEPWIQRLVATAATATAPQLEDNNEDGHFRDLEYEGMVELNILILLCGEAAQVAGLEGTGVSSDLEKTLQVTNCLQWEIFFHLKRASHPYHLCRAYARKKKFTH